ncbi:RDD family protein [Portibacter lacus]|uniref:RDD domain-containing protein n=1 Tax=Portibacter lacus TaxID=1099794 RepID=A0AA37SRK0_9BACT|nr:RDD family protein [Portibacter lacus]GLR18902.1 hypothetical protein GCM10007940_35180 [Portibacter lacus]
MHEEEYYEYAGFGQRFLAIIIDVIILGVCGSGVAMLFGGLFIGTAGGSAMLSDGEIGEGAMLVGVLLYLVFIFSMMVAGWLYFALQESSSKMATLGKRAVGIVVTDMEGNRISFARATGRYFGKMISGAIMYVGYIMAAFTEKKQALHDMIANSLVMKDH